MKNNFYKKVSILKQYAKENGINNQTLEIMSKASGLSIEKIQELLAIPTGSVIAPKSFIDKLDKKDLEVLAASTLKQMSKQQLAQLVLANTYFNEKSIMISEKTLKKLKNEKCLTSKSQSMRTRDRHV